MTSGATSVSTERFDGALSEAVKQFVFVFWTCTLEKLRSCRPDQSFCKFSTRNTFLSQVPEIKLDIQPVHSSYSDLELFHPQEGISIFPSFQA